MKKYNIEIIEKYKYIREFEANSKTEAIKKAKEYYKNIDKMEADGAMIADTNTFDSVEFTIIQSEINKLNMIPYAVPNNTPIIISADKAEEFLNMKTDEKLKEEREKRLAKYSHIITDNTKK